MKTWRIFNQMNSSSIELTKLIPKNSMDITKIKVKLEENYRSIQINKQNGKQSTI